MILAAFLSLAYSAAKHTQIPHNLIESYETPL